MDPTEEETQLATGMLLCACIPALGSTTNVWQTGLILPAKAVQVSYKLFSPSARRRRLRRNVRVYNYVKNVVLKSIKS